MAEGSRVTIVDPIANERSQSSQPDQSEACLT
jgi:hypothetical protein